MFKQITVFLENKPGRMEEATACLANENINLLALSLADTTDFGILRLIVSEPDRAVDVLKEKGFMVKTSGVIAMAIGHSPGSLNKVLRELNSLDISIEYMYAFTSRHIDYGAIVILRLENQDAAISKIENSKLPILGDELLDSLNEAQ